jgi:hypothetical protein
VRLESQLQVPGGAQNLSMDSNPVSWSPQLTDPPHVEIYRQRTRTVHRRGLAPLRIRFWELVSTQRGSFADGYPALCEFRFDSTMPGMYKLVFRGEFAEGFTHGGARDWKSTRYLALAATRFTPKVATPRIKSRLKRGKRATITGSLTLNRRAFVDLTVQRLTHRGWHAYKSVRVRSGIKGTWVARTSVKRTGRYRIRAAVAGRVVSRICEFAPARSHWRRFSVR